MIAVDDILICMNNRLYSRKFTVGKQYRVEDVYYGGCAVTNDNGDKEIISVRNFFNTNDYLYFKNINNKIFTAKVVSVSLGVPEQLIGQTVTIDRLLRDNKTVIVRDKNNRCWGLTTKNIQFFDESVTSSSCYEQPKEKEIKMENDFETKVRKNNQMKKMKFIPKDDIEFISINGVEGILIPDNDVDIGKKYNDLSNKIITNEKNTKEIDDEYEYGKIVYRNERGQYHNINDEPAIIWKYGTKFWYKNGKIHRTKGPAKIYPNGDEFWWYEDNDITEQVKQLMKEGRISSDWKNWTEEDEIMFISLIS